MNNVSEAVEKPPCRQYELQTNTGRETRYDVVTLDYLINAVAAGRINGSEYVRYGNSLEVCTVEQLLRAATAKANEKAEAKQEPLSTAKS